MLNSKYFKIISTILLLKETNLTIFLALSIDNILGFMASKNKN